MLRVYRSFGMLVLRVFIQWKFGATGVRSLEILRELHEGIGAICTLFITSTIASLLKKNYIKKNT